MLGRFSRDAFRGGLRNVWLPFLARASAGGNRLCRSAFRSRISSAVTTPPKMEPDEEGYSVGPEEGMVRRLAYDS